MRRSDRGQRGAPLIMLFTVIGTWSIYRAFVWEAPSFPSLEKSNEIVFAGKADAPSASFGVTREIEGGASSSPTANGPRQDFPGWSSGAIRDTQTPFTQGANLSIRREVAISHLSDRAGTRQEPDGGSQEFRNPETVPPRSPLRPISNALPLFGVAGFGQQSATSSPSRWSGDAWALFRDTATAVAVSPQPSYGRSQAGGVVRYELAPSSGARPQAYLRTSSGLEGPREREIAVGVSARPVPSLPLRVQAEARYFDYEGGSEARAAVFAVTELPPQQLPGGFRAETYAQAGYVSGRFATPFVDAQARIAKPVARISEYEFDTGVGAWGGAQEGTERLDIGPSVSLRFPIGDVNARIAADYRFRVAGAAAPASGPVLTVSAGF